jgi:predicted  nucleic acid-binding Zn-ribbon protein
MTRSTPVSYAENELKVHAVHDDALAAHETLTGALDEYAAASRTIRSTHEAIERREHVLASDIKGGDPGMSQEALKRALKDAQHTDDELVSLRAALHQAQDRQNNSYAVIEREKYRLRVLSARMNELGGLLSFYAAAKTAAAQQRK